MPPTDCMQAREAVSARLDGELAELGSARLDQHLAGCAACRAFAANALGIVEELRAAPLEAAPAHVFVPRRRHFVRPAAVAAATLIVAVAAGASFAIGEILGGQVSSPAVTASATQHRLDPGVLAMLQASRLRHVQAGKVVAV